MHYGLITLIVLTIVNVVMLLMYVYMHVKCMYTCLHVVISPEYLIEIDLR